MLKNIKKAGKKIKTFFMAFAHTEYKKMASRTLKVMRGVKFYKKGFNWKSIKAENGMREKFSSFLFFLTFCLPSLKTS